MSVSAPVIGFRPVVHNDLPTLAGWLEAPHWRRWWGDPVVELAHIRDMIEGRDTTRPYHFTIDGECAGYIQAWFIGHHLTPEWTSEYPWLAALPSETVGVDLAIGDPGNLGKGYGSAVLATFVRRLYSEGHETIIIDPDPANGRAVRAYEKAGFRPVPHLLGRTDDTLIMQHHKAPSESTP